MSLCCNIVLEYLGYSEKPCRQRIMQRILPLGILASRVALSIHLHFSIQIMVCLRICDKVSDEALNHQLLSCVLSTKSDIAMTYESYRRVRA